MIITPDNLDKTPIDLIEQYQEKVRIGREAWNTKKVIITGLARNCEKSLYENIPLIGSTCSNFEDFKVVIYENNSTDNTRIILDEFQKHNPNFVTILGSNDDQKMISDKSESRILRMVKYRTIIQDYIKTNCSDYDYVINIDLDMSGGWSVDGLMTALAWEDFDVMGSVSQVYKSSIKKWLHYDRWAFKFHSWTEEWSDEETSSDLIWFWDWKPARGAKPIECLSVFGGLAIYKMEAYLSGEYGCRHPDFLGSFITSEHNQFHYSMRQKGYDKVFLNPSQRCIV
jgi:hypothetical protein